MFFLPHSVHPVLGTGWALHKPSLSDGKGTRVMHCMAQEHSPRDLVQNRQGTRPDVGVQAGGTDRKRRGLGARWKLASEGQNKQDVQSQGKHRH